MLLPLLLLLLLRPLLLLLLLLPLLLLRCVHAIVVSMWLTEWKHSEAPAAATASSTCGEAFALLLLLRVRRNDDKHKHRQQLVKTHPVARAAQVRRLGFVHVVDCPHDLQQGRKYVRR